MMHTGTQEMKKRNSSKYRSPIRRDDSNDINNQGNFIFGVVSRDRRHKALSPD